MCGLSFIQVEAQDNEIIWGRVLGSNNQAVSGAVIHLNKQEVAQTNARGAFRIEAEQPLPVEISIAFENYMEYTAVLTALNYHADQGLKVQLTEAQYELDEVLVTIRRDNSYTSNALALGGKFNGRLKDLPQSVTLLTREFIQDKNAFHINDVVQDMSGVTLASSYDDFIIRGFKSGYESGIRLVNGLRSGYGYGNAYYRSPMTINLESIQVLKGPGGSLFGDIVPGGTVNMVTKRPLEEQKGYVDFSVGSFNTYRTTLDLGGPLDKDKKILYRLNAGYENARTFRDINQQTTYAFMPSFTFKPSDKTQLDVDLVFDAFDGYLDRGMGIRSADLFALPRSFSFSQPSDYYKSSTTSFSGRFQQRINSAVSLHLSYMKSIYKEDVNEHRTLNTFADTPLNTIMNLRFFDRHGRDYTDNAVAYLKWDMFGGHVDHHWVGGVDYANYRGDKDNQLREARSKQLNGEVIPLTFDMNNPTYELQDTSNYVWRPQGQYPFLSPYQTTGIYLQDQMSIGYRLKLLAGVRYERYHSETTDSKDRQTAQQHVFLPRLGLTYEVSDAVNYFASYAQGFTPVGANMVLNHRDYGSDNAFQPEKSFQVETGVKTAFFNKQLQFDVALFHIERRDMLLTTGALTDAGLPVYRQSGKVTSSGVEVDVRGQITPELQLLGGYTYNKTNVKASSIASEVGLSLGGAPKNMANLWLKYVFSTSALKGLGAGVGVYHVGQRRMDASVGADANGTALWDYWPEYTTFNAALFYHIDALKIAVNLDNAFDKYYYYGGFDYTRAFPGTPRTLKVSLGYHF